MKPFMRLVHRTLLGPQGKALVLELHKILDEVKNVPHAERLAPQPTKAGKCDLTGGKMLFEDSALHARVVPQGMYYYPCTGCMPYGARLGDTGGTQGHGVLGGALRAVRAQCNYLGVWPY